MLVNDSPGLPDRVRIAVSAVLILVFAVSINLYAQSSVESNGKRILELSLDKLISSPTIDSLSVPVYLTGNLCDAYRYEVTKYLLSNHKKVSSQSSNVSRLKLQVTTSNQYREVGNDEAVRTINGGLTITLTDTTGIIKNMEHFTFASTDTLPAGLYQKLQSDWEPSKFMGGHKKKGWIKRKILEPGLLLGAIGVTVYLLFNVRGS